MRPAIVSSHSYLALYEKNLATPGPYDFHRHFTFHPKAFYHATNVVSAFHSSSVVGRQPASQREVRGVRSNLRQRAALARLEMPVVQDHCESLSVLIVVYCGGSDV